MIEATGAICVFIALVAYLVWRHFSNEIRSATAVASDGCMTYVGSNRELILIRLSEPARIAPVYATVSQALVPVQIFSLGFLTGVCFVLLIARLALSPSSADLALWTTFWIIAVAVTWGVVLAAEHVLIEKFHRTGVFRELLSNGADPLAIASALSLAIRTHRIWIVVTMLIGLAVVSLGQWLVTGVLFACVAAILIAYRTQPHLFESVAPWDAEKPLLSLREQVREGVWIGPVGLVLMLSTVVLMGVSSVSAVLAFIVLNAGIILVLWGERVSRATTFSFTVDEWKHRLKERLQGGQVSEAPVNSLA